MSDELVLTIDPPYIGSAVSPEVDITETDTTYTVDITDFRGVHSYTVEKTDQAIADAETAATNANTAAANATSTANAAAQYARDTADQAAADAQETADAAAGRADTAAASANQAAQSANTAAGTANTSAQNADAKAALADSKAGLANQAATTANNAAQAAEAAKTAANTAAGQATTAAGNANTAAQTATTAASNADAKASLADTAAANADTATQAANTATTAATNAAQAANNAADYAIEAADDMPKLVNTASGTTPQTVNDAWPTTPESAVLYGKSVQDGTPTPDNPVPVQVVGGMNLLKPTARMVTASGVTYSANSNGQITLTGTATANNSFTIYQGITSAFETGQYTCSLSGAVNGRLGNRQTAQTSTITKGSLISFAVAITSGVTYNETFNAQFEVGTQATPYVPYGCVGLQIGETVTPIDLQGHTLASLPDGTRDVLRVDSTGRVWIEKNTYLTTLGTFTFNVSSPEQHIFRSRQFGNNPAPYAPYGGATTIGLSSGYEPKGYAPLSASDNGKFAIGGAYIGEVLVVIDFRYSTLEEFAAATANTQLLYKLYEPQTIELGTIELPELTQTCELAIYASLDPEWQIEYTQDPNVVISTLAGSIAPIEGETASTNYAVGAYLIHGNQLYRVTSAIATGEAITPGSNCVACTVMGEVIRLTA